MILAKIQQMSDAEIQAWLRRVGAEKVNDLVTALLGADQGVINKILQNMSPRAGQVLKTRLEAARAARPPAEAISRRGKELEQLI